MEQKPKRVLFVCIGNICRSPAAEEVFRAMAEEAGMADVAALCDSCGTEDYHEGALPDSRMRMAAQRRGYVLQHRARQTASADFSNFDLILPMEKEVEDTLRKNCPAALQNRIRPFADYCRKSNPGEIPDPYFGGAEGFELVLNLLEEGCAELIRELSA